MPVDMIVRNAEDIERRLQLGDRFIQEILARGKVMYDAADSIKSCRRVRRTIRVSLGLPV